METSPTVSQTLDGFEHPSKYQWGFQQELGRSQASGSNFGKQDQGREFRAGGHEASTLHRRLPGGRKCNYTGREKLIKSLKRIADRGDHHRTALQGPSDRE
ncbi:unnamed protein product [Tuber aestivum]|uniref:Uncharacterized protein n=1 Tax=Tuber aestivum TaxID=59557 RepID=A0A292PRG0_9PEZI|nr:unnamed protein product [Tuber aestivum]